MLFVILKNILCANIFAMLVIIFIFAKLRKRILDAPIRGWISFPKPEMRLSHRLSIVPLLSAYPCKIPAVRSSRISRYLT